MRVDRRVLLLWLLVLALITYREFKTPAADASIPGIPRPWAYTGASAAFGFTALVSEANGPLGVALALAFALAIFLGYFAGGPTKGKVEP